MATNPGRSSSLSSLEGKTFDIIIVGGGTAGLVLASRLTEDPSTSVLVVEAGSHRPDDPKILTPGLSGTLYADPQYDWTFETTPQAHLHNRKLPQPRGRVLGGSSAINFAMLLYPSKACLDNWGKLGNSGWLFEDLEPYLRKFSTVHVPSEKTKELLGINYLNEKSSNGPVHVSIGDEYTPISQAWAETFAKLGYKMNADPSEGKAIGGFPNAFSIDPKTNTRSHAATAYYGPDVASRPNLQVLTETIVEKILLNKGSDGSLVAEGVQVVTNLGEKRSLLAKDEVILSAGAVQSPQLLEVSGIGGRELLKSHGIPVLVDNPNVGENLQDHTLVTQSFEVADGMPSADMFRDPNILQAVMTQFQTTHSGPLGASSIMSAYMPLVDINGAVDVEELDLDSHLGEGKYPDFPAQRQQYELLRKILETKDEPSGQYMLFPSQVNVSPEGSSTMGGMLLPENSGNYISVMTILNHSFSRGTCHIHSPDPAEKPTLDPRFMSHPLDLEVLSRHTQFVDRLVKAEPFASVLKKDGRRLPATSAESGLDAAREIVRRRLISVFHPVGTCAMLPREKGGVVDDKLFVYDVKNLRVVDASIFPLIPLGNIISTVYAVAEKAADMIKASRARK